ncbi:DUF1850 domain-containing protein [Archaeoglobus neptunius]|uniref:DUF1850 domain-containing protein n=1 Tax=Archaeoglobus neptunius TaxID=2798580 RepID=UPI001928B3B6|nr:DUF1850 domain-containing protein [Archaeoglobus neptunius]
MKKIIPLAILILLVASAQNTYLMISGNKGECFVSVAEGDTFTVSFIHSVELSKEIDFFKIVSGSIKLEKTLVKSSGWGLPSTEKNFSIASYKGEEWFEYKIERDIGTLKISTSPVNDYRLEIGALNISLGGFGRDIEVKIVRLNPAMAMLGRCWNE